MKIICLGSGTSDGVPVIGCKCNVCLGSNILNKRLRTTYYFQDKDVSILLDASPDLREQSLKFNIEKLDAVLISHAHYDHMSGLAELKRFNELNEGISIKVYSNQESISILENKFDYFVSNVQIGGGLPKVSFNVVSDAFYIKHLKIVPIPIKHGKLNILGYRINNFAFITDASDISEESINLLKGVDLLILNAIRYRPHSTHFNIEQATELAKKVGAKQTYFTHLTHDINQLDLAGNYTVINNDYYVINDKLPNNINFAYDGLKMEI